MSLSSLFSFSLFIDNSLHFYLTSSPSLFISLDLSSLLYSPVLCVVAVYVAVLLLCVLFGWLVLLFGWLCVCRCRCRRRRCCRVSLLCVIVAVVVCCVVVAVCCGCVLWSWKRERGSSPVRLTKNGPPRRVITFSRSSPEVTTGCYSC